jgi:hypothetical protein
MKVMVVSSQIALFEDFENDGSPLAFACIVLSLNRAEKTWDRGPKMKRAPK